jgi:hypothetical protein
VNSPSPTSSSLSPRACCILSLLVFFLVIQSAWGELINEAYIGGPIHGMNHDDTKRVSNQTGHFVNLVSLKSVHLNIPKNRIESGASFSLNSSLLWDDQSVDDLPYSLADWGSSDKSLVFQNGKVKVPETSERISVNLVVKSHGMEASTVLYVLADEYLAEKLKKSNLPVALKDSVDLEYEGWKSSDWIGTYYDSGNGWIFHLDHGWLYIVEADASSVWFWEEEQQWLWTGKEIYPHLYRNRDSAWLYFMQPALPQKVYFNYTSNRLERQ